MSRPQQHAAVTGNEGKQMTGSRKIARANIGFAESATAGSALFRRDPGTCIGLVVDGHRKRSGMIGFVVSNHRIEPQPARIISSNWRANYPRSVPDDESHLFGG